MFRKAAGLTSVFVCLLSGGHGGVSLAQTGDVLVGVTWTDGTLVSLDPSSGQVLQRHVQIDPDESFVALAYDRLHGRLYALTQVDHTLYTLDAATLQLTNSVPLRLDAAPGTDAMSLACDPITDTLYTTIGHWENYPAGPISDELAKLDPWTGETTTVGTIDGSWITGLAFSETERVLYALGVSSAGAWDSPDATRVLRIDPATAASGIVYVTPYHAMMGIALKDPGTFYSWINGASHFFGQTDLVAQALAPLGGDEESGPVAAMLLRTFDLPPQPVGGVPSPAGFVFEGHVTAVADPKGRLRGQVSKGQAFRGQINYDAGMPFKSFISGQNSYGVSLQSRRLRYAAPDYAARLENNRLDPGDAGPTDEFRIRAVTPSGVVLSWTLIDAGGNAVQADGLPADFDLSRWQTNMFSVIAYDPCCADPLYRFDGRVDDIRRRSGSGTPPLRPGRRDGK